MARKQSGWRSTGRQVFNNFGRKSTTRRRHNFVRPVGLGLERLEDRRLLAAGDLDTTFGIGGKVVQDLGIGKDEEIYASAVQNDGRIIVAGLVNNPGGSGRDFLISRFNSNGSLDTSFGTSGRVVIDVSDPGSGSTPNFDDSASDIAILGDGSILVSGSASKIPGPGTNRFNGVALVKLTSTGALDPTFGTGGKTVAVLKNASNQNINVATANGSTVSIAVQSDGRIVCGATTANTDILARRDFAVVRFNATGALDTTFDGDGYVITDFQGDFTHDDHLYDIALQSDGKIIAVGDAFTNFVKPTGSADFAVVRYNTNGSLDTTFNGTGFRLTDISPTSLVSADSARNVSIQADGKIVVGGYTQNRPVAVSPDDFDFVVARYNTNGTLDTSFGAASEVPGTKRVNIGSTDIAEGFAVQPDGKYVIAGFVGGTSGAGVDLGIARLLANGNLDTSFSGDGLQTAHFASTSFTIIGDMAIQPDNKLLVAGFVGTTGGNFDIAMARFESGLVVQSISGAASVAEGSSYNLTLASSDPTTSQWVITWGDGNVQTVPGNPSTVAHTYTDGPNNYTISATITTSTGTSPVGNTVAVSVLNVSPTLSISGASSVNEGSAYTLNLSSSDPGADTITSWTINWGDGVQTVMGNPSSVTHTYADGNASRTISATATDEDGTFAAGNTVAVAVNNVAPTLTISGAATVNEGALYTLNLTSSDPGADTITQWTINWGDGAPQVVSGNPSSVSHTYADGNNNYTISATATDEDGTFTAGNTVAVAVQNVAPTLTVSGASDVNEGSPYTLNLSSLDPGADTITQWSINWGDGTQVVSGNPSSVTHTYADGNAAYTISATATDEDGTFAAGNSVGVTVHNVAPTLAISGASDVNEGSSYTLNLSSFDPGADTIIQWTINWGDGTQVVSGNPTSVTHTYTDGDASYTISATATDEDGTFAAGNTVGVTVHNVAPTANNATFSIAENSPNGTVVGTVTATDPGNDTLSFSIVGGTGAAAFAINSATGQITVANSSLLDFETTPTLTLDVQVSDGDGGFATASVTVNLVNLASISGVVFVDVNQNGLFDANEPGIDGVVVKLLDQSGNAVLDEFGQPVTRTTSNGGLYIFDDLGPGTYQLFEMQPTGVTDGAEHLGSLGGTVVTNDRMQLTLAGVDAYDYAFAEIGQHLTTGDAATIGFWQNKNGQALIVQGGTQLAAWLTANFSNVFGNTLAGATGSDVATFYREQLFKQQSKKSAGPAKVDAQFMAVALATYFTSQNLAGTVAASYGFHVTDTGIGTKVVNVGTKGAAFNVANGSDRTIMQLLLATNSLTDQPNAFSGFAAVYDTDGNGVISTAEAGLRTMANDLYTFINESGGV